MELPATQIPIAGAFLSIVGSLPQEFALTKILVWCPEESLVEVLQRGLVRSGTSPAVEWGRVPCSVDMP